MMPMIHNVPTQNPIQTHKREIKISQDHTPQLIIIDPYEYVIIHDVHACELQTCTREITYIIGKHAKVIIVHQHAALHDAHLSMTITLRAAEESFVEYLTALSSGAIIQKNIKAELCGVGSNITIHGSYAIDNQQQLQIHTQQHHMNKHTNSSVIFKGLVGDRGYADYRGAIKISEASHQAQAAQSNIAMLMSANARSVSIPSLEILTNQVQCKHGSATGPFDAQHLYYLVSRGFDEQQARALLLKAFFADVYPSTAQHWYDAWIDNQIRGYSNE